MMDTKYIIENGFQGENYQIKIEECKETKESLDENYL